MKSKLKDNLAIKIISVLAAIILWFYIQMVQNPEIDFTFNNMRVSLVNSSLLEERNLIVLDDVDFKTDITVNCPRWNLNELTEEDFVAYVDLSEIKSAGNIELPIKVRMNNENIIVSGKSPSTVNISVDTVVNVEKDLVVHTVGKVKDNHYTHDSMVVPDTDKITVRGPKSILSKIANGVVTVDVSNKTGNFSDVYKVVLVDEQGTAIVNDRVSVLNGNVNVNTTVYATKVIPVKLSNIPEKIKYSITPPNVEVAGPENVLESLDEILVEDFRVQGNDKGYTQGVDIKLPQDVIMITDVVPQFKILDME